MPAAADEQCGAGVDERVLDVVGVVDLAGGGDDGGRQLLDGPGAVLGDGVGGGEFAEKQSGALGSSVRYSTAAPSTACAS